MSDFNGDDSDNIFTGDSANDRAFGNGGNDTLNGNDGYDVLAGGTGADTLDGGDGDDSLFSGSYIASFILPYYSNSPFNPPVIDAGSERDTLVGGDGSDRIYAGYGDTVDGGANGSYGDYLYVSFIAAPNGITFDGGLSSQVIGGATISGIENISFVQGSNFDDTINGRSTGTGYSDFAALMGMGGRDTLIAGYYTGTLFGGDGDDIVDGRGSQYLQAVYGDDGDDTLYTNTNTFASAYGGAGNDTIYAHGTIYGGSGDDRIIIQPSYYGGIVRGEAGNDSISVTSSFDGVIVSGGAGADGIEGSNANDQIASGEIASNGALMDDIGTEHDIVRGLGGNDIISVGYGDDADGGTGNDTLLLSLAGASAGVTFSNAGITGATSFAYAGGTIVNFENFTYLRGSAFDDRITIETQATRVTVIADAGNDVITSNGSSVTVNGGAGDDRFVSGQAGDIFDGGDGSDTVDYNANTSGLTITLASTAGAAASGGGGDTLINVENIIGTAFADTLIGNASSNIFSGGGGNDTLDGGGGSDTLIGGAGDDLYRVDSGGDVVIEAAGEGNDRVLTSASFALAAGQEIETLETADAASAMTIALTGNEFANRITGNAGANQLSGGGGNDVLFGGGGDDLLDGGTGGDTMDGGTGNDIYIVDDQNDVVIEAANAGSDEIRTVLAAYSIAGQTNIEKLTGSAATGQSLTGNSGDNVITGSSGGDLLYGLGGSDTLYGNGGNDLLDGGTGNDTMDGGTGNDVYVVDAAGDMVIEGANAGTDEIRTALTSYSIASLANVENLTGTSPTGQTLTGNGGDNIITGGTGADTLAGGAGNDTFYVRDAGDVVIEDAGAAAGRDTVISFLTSYILAENVEKLAGGLERAAGAAGQVLSGNALDNEIIGSHGNDWIDGGTGADILIGGDGYDIYVVDNVGDVIVNTGGSGSVVTTLASYTLGTGMANLIGVAAGAQTLTGNADANIISGGAGADTIDGGAGDDTIDGGASNDRMTGGTGNDTFHVRDAGDVVVEGAGGGRDGVISFLTSYILADNVEKLTAGLDRAAGSAGQVLSGNALDNEIVGSRGNDWIDGGAGADILIGGDGYDTYVVDNVGDVIVNTGGTGSVVTTLAGYTLGTGMANLIGVAGRAQTLTGNADANIINGGIDGDTIDGGAGNDTMTGGAGNDIYYVRDSGDVIVEQAGGAAGRDTVISFLTSYILAENVEKLAGGLERAAGAAGQVLSGNALDNEIIGSHGNDWIDGGTGADILIGGDGYDIYVVDNVGDVIVNTGGSGSVVTTLASYTLGAGMANLIGVAAGAQTLTGNADANIIKGGSYGDTIDGGAGADIVVMSGVQGSGYDRLINFDAAQDRIDLPNAVTGIDAPVTGGRLDDTAFQQQLTSLAASLQANHALLFTADAGNQAGHSFLVIDQNGQAGYQADGDLVIELVTPIQPAIDITAFI